MIYHSKRGETMEYFLALGIATFCAMLIIPMALGLIFIFFIIDKSITLIKEGIIKMFKK
jgi:hypothetical protein